MAFFVRLEAVPTSLSKLFSLVCGRALARDLHLIARKRPPTIFFRLRAGSYNYLPSICKRYERSLEKAKVCETAECTYLVHEHVEQTFNAL